MPTQRPLPEIAESQEKILRNVGWQLGQLDQLAQRLGPGPFIGPDTRPSLDNLIGLMRVFNSLCSDTGAANDRPWNWQGVEEWQAIAGFKSDKTCREAIKVLASMGLIEVKDKWAGNNKRRLHVRIVWERFLDKEITQDDEDIKLWSARHARRKNRKRQGKLFGDAHRTYSVAATAPIRCASPNASICDPQRYPPIHPEREGGREFEKDQWARGKGQGGGLIQTEEGDRDEAIFKPREANDRSLSVGRADDSGSSFVSAVEVILGSPSVPPCLRGESENYQRGNEEPRTKNQERSSLISRLWSLGLDSPHAVLRASQRAGYSEPQIEAIVAWYESQARTDSAGKVWYPYTVKQLAWRLRDELALEMQATPARGSWKGGQCGIWRSLGGDNRQGPRGKGQGADTGMVVPTREQAASLALLERARGLARHNGIELIRLTSQTPGEFQERCLQALRYIDQGGWPAGAIVTPKPLVKLLAELLGRDERSEVRGESQNKECGQ